MNHPNQKPAKEIALRYTLKSSHILSLDIEKAASHKVFETTNKLVPEDLRWLTHTFNCCSSSGCDSQLTQATKTL